MTTPNPPATDGLGPTDDGSGATDLLGVVDGTRECTTSEFGVVIANGASVELDDLVSVSQQLPDGTELTHYGIVSELHTMIEGASWSTDTVRVADATMPGETIRCAVVRVLRPYPERWVAPSPAAPVARVRGAARDRALFADQMERRLAIGLDARDEPIYVDFDFVNGRKGGHVNVSGISGVATKTTSLLALLYLMFETPAGRALLGRNLDQTRALVLSVKNEDLLHIDRPNVRMNDDDRRRWAALGVDEPGGFSDVSFYVPPRPRSANVVAHSETRVQIGDVTAFGWTPWEFVTKGLLAYVIADADDSANQLSFVEQRVRAALLRWAWPSQDQPGAVVLREPDDGPARTFERAHGQVTARAPRPVGPDGALITNFSDLVDFVTVQFDNDNQDFCGTNSPQTIAAFARRLAVMVGRIGHLIRTGVEAPTPLERLVTVVDIHALHDSAQRFVVGAIVNEIFDEKQETGREPLRFIMLDELNKFCPDHGRSPLRELLVDIAERGRSMGVLLLGAQQHAGSVDATVIRNAAVKMVGRLDAGDLDAYRFLPPEMRDRATLFVPGSMVVHQPIIPAPLPIRVPFPPFATSPEEAERAPDDPDAVNPFELPEMS